MGALPSWLVRFFHGRIADDTFFAVGVACGLGADQVLASLAQQHLSFLSIWKFADLTAWIGGLRGRGQGDLELARPFPIAGDPACGFFRSLRQCDGFPA
jgi:hypothetical protein